MIDLFLIRSADKRTSGGGGETPMLGVASYTNCVGYTCPPEGPAGRAQLPVGYLPLLISLSEILGMWNKYKEHHGTRRKIYQIRCHRTIHTL